MTDLDKGKASPATFMDPPGAKRSRNRTRKPKPDEGTPGHRAAAAANSAMVPASPDGVGHAVVPGICYHGDVAAPDAVKRAPLGTPSANPLAQALRYLAEKSVVQGGILGNPANPQGAGSAAEMAAPAAAYGNPHSSEDFNQGRVSESLGRDHCHASTSSGDHGSGQGRPGWVAYGSPGTPGEGPVDVRLNQSDANAIMPWMRRAPAQTAFVGQAAWGGPMSFSGTDTSPQADAGRVRVQQLGGTDAGRFSGRNRMDPNPGSRPADFAQSRGSGTSPNGGHSLRDAESRAVANKGRSNLDIMRDEMRRLG